MKKAYIWDFDGTLLDSYDIIVSSLHETYQKFGIDTNKDDILKHAIRYSVSSFIHSKEILEYLSQQGALNFAFTKK